MNAVRKFARSWAPFALGAIAVATLATVPAAVPVPVAKETVLEIRARPILIEDAATSDLAEIRVEVRAEETVETAVVLPADRRPGMPSRIDIEAEGRVGAPNGPHRIDLRARWRSADGSPASAQRSLEVHEGTTGFFEAAHGPGWRVTLAVRAERMDRMVARTPREPGRPVVFLVEVGRIVAGDYVALETNELSTFRGEPVEYSFRLGRETTLEDLRLVLTPVRIEGEVAEVRVEMSGSLHRGRDTPLLLSRNETLITGRSTTSEISAAVGQPPEGFRFRITPVW